MAVTCGKPGGTAAGGSAAIEVSGLRKSFGDHVVLDGIDLSVPAGSVFGLAAKTVASASNGPFPLILLPLVGSGIVPTSTMPTGLRYFAEYQPFTPMINTLRGLLLGTPVGWSWLIALAWCAGLGLIGLIWSISVFNRRDRKRGVPGPGFPGAPAQ